MWEHKTTLRWIEGARGEAACEGKPSIISTPPPTFGGEADKWSPEDLFVSAIETCLMMTALDVARRQKIPLRAYRSAATGHLEKTKEGLRFSGVEIDIWTTCDSPADQERMAQAVRTAEKYCPVSNAAKCPITVRVGAGD